MRGITGYVRGQARWRWPVYSGSQTNWVPSKAVSLGHTRRVHQRRVLAYATAGTDRFGAAQTTLTATPVPRDP